ncbi:spermine synthase [uncultured Paenibacillus sp.]|uniref:spermine/spermidine synthase domain-containing protein n=2 Tax=Paenibacillus TaxID=44249 RepID=UPI0015A7DBB6|nr:spermine synthase [uncultured Paenibacillus sp.]
MIKSINIKGNFLILLSIFFVSVSLFVYQVILTRIYSALLSYHYTFLITSFAICGVGVGSVLVYMQQKKAKEPGKIQKVQSIGYAAFLLALFYLVILSVIYKLPYINSVLIYALLGTLPFVIGGYYISLLFRLSAGISNKLYFADLLGSGVGSVVVLLLMNNLGMFRSSLVIAIIALLAALSFSLLANFKRLIAVTIVSLVLLSSGLFVPVQYINSIEKNFNGLLTNPGKTFGFYQYEGENAEIISTEWNSFSRTDVIRLPEIPDYMVVTIDGAANAPMMKYNGDLSSLEKYKKETEFLPFSIGKNDKSLIIGPGGGRDILYALAAGSKDITAVEINTSSIDAVEKYSDFNGNIYNLPEVKVYAEDGRNFVRRTNDKFDTIFLSLVMTNASQSVGYALSENYIYTVEAVKDYLNKLESNGRVAFLAHDQNDLEKIVATSISALTQRGVPLKEAPKYIAILAKNMPPSEHGGDAEHIHYPIVIIKNVPFTENESNQLLDKALQGGNTPLFLPNIYEEGPLKHLEDEHDTFKQFTAKFSNNVVPSTDDSPYFYNFEKGLPTSLLNLLAAVGIGSVILFVPFLIRNRNLKRPALYFGLLGAGFMLIETPLIQKFSLYFGHPVLTFSYILAALLVGSGLGGYMSRNKSLNKILKNDCIPPLLVVVVNIALILLLEKMFLITSEWSLVNKIIVASILVMIQGFFMGIPFPRGLKRLEESGKEDAIPMMFGINGVMSVMGSVLAVILSMSLGFNGALLVGGFIYALISVINRP